MLAAGIGNIHGKYPCNKFLCLSHILFNRIMRAVKHDRRKTPLVLHGGTGIPEDMIKKAISLGVAKINVNAVKHDRRKTCFNTSLCAFI